MSSKRMKIETTFVKLFAKVVFSLGKYITVSKNEQKNKPGLWTFARFRTIITVYVIIYFIVLFKEELRNGKKNEDHGW